MKQLCMHAECEREAVKLHGLCTSMKFEVIYEF